MQTTSSRRAAVLGKPIAHSLSPVIHRAGFAAAGLTGWTYEAIECAEAELPGLVAGLGPEWAGLSLTMPLKETALTLAASATPAAIAAGVANTLIRQDDGGWHADNTDIPGMVRVLRAAGLGAGTGRHAAKEAPPRITVLGGGGTARAALAAAAELGAEVVTVVTRRPEARAELEPVAGALGVKLDGAPWSAAALDADAVISTVPKGAADALAAEVTWRSGGVFFDALYDPWPTPLAASAIAAGVTVVSGLDLLLAQALSQFEQFTGVAEAPEEAMRAALDEAARNR
ncbi:shikimate 5-dehydrogenase [Actinoplanes sp. SE50]|uniref:shikimate dehydrogenase n=1 Tax=unclassified Actinoplanes TaxID=2626549 RepID=UPI00023ED6B0|nr:MULTISPECIES: shikimate dehydrogenase [unclassified Actinoplanes]AEV87368.1 shikimate 5-dehydrogenase [Actinoplanes sp. SE50/110]ATO85768.1 shikimate 5-dehydrogenase [Actinoplanes sp. SE50]SLM03181.1 shikimate dehydrogenase [Actinoplanes sp. SE50/110]